MTSLSIASYPNLEIRLIAPDDAQSLLEAVLASRTEISKWENWALTEPTLEIEQDFIAAQIAAHAAKTMTTFVILDKPTQKLIGTCTAFVANAANKVGNIGYWVHSHHTRQDIASSSCKAVAQYAFTTYGFERLEFVMQVGNTASRRVAEKCGATFEGVLRSRLFYDGAGRDAAVYSLLKSE